MNVKCIDLHSIKIKPLVISLLIPFAAGLISYLLSGDIKTVYAEIRKPFFAPPDWIFPVVWTILFLLMGISCYMVSVSGSPLRKKALMFYGVQLFLNTFWTFIFFRLEMFLLALIWVAAMLVIVTVMCVYFYKIKPLAAYLQAPYLLWLTFALMLNAGVYFLN